MMNEEVAKYRELSGDTNPNTPISRIGGYLDGYEKALEQEPCEDTKKALEQSTMNVLTAHNTMDILIKHLTENNLVMCSKEFVEEAEKALEQKPCEDAISRQAVKELIKSGISTDTYDDVEQVCKWIDALPSVTVQTDDFLLDGIHAVGYREGYKDAKADHERQTGKWIPVSERLPEDGQNVLFCDNDNDIMIGYHVKGRPNTHFSQDGTYEDMKNVRAWMPLPTPYKPQERSE